MSKIYLVNDSSGTAHLVRAHTTAGARNFIARKLRNEIHAKVPSQDELVGALGVGITIEDATAEPENAS